jgi:NAD(P)-dependent dehydrogenase (short-subunit alcohol dehydrogenase family)
MAETQVLSGKTALVTGASMGLGRRMALTLAAAGADVALTARSADKLADLARVIEGAGGRAAAFSLNVRNVSEVQTVVAEVEADRGPIDVLVNNAGVSVTKRPEDFSDEDYDFVLETNLKGPFQLAQAVGRRMIERRSGGKIINIASMVGFKALGQLTLYGMSKAAMIQMTRQLALEWARHDIQVNAICPGYIETPMNREHWQTPAGEKLISRMPRQRVGGEEALQALDGTLLLLAGAESNFINGAIIPVDDAQSLM